MDNTKLATELLHVFGYITAKEGDVFILSSSFGYLKVKHFSQIYYFLRKNDTWTMKLEKTERKTTENLTSDQRDILLNLLINEQSHIHQQNGNIKPLLENYKNELARIYQIICNTYEGQGETK